MSYTIKEAAAMLHLPATTLRYYEKEGLLPPVQRHHSGRRQYSEADLMSLRVIECLKRTGMSIKEIKQFADWVQMGDASFKERHQMFLERKRAVEKQIQELQQTLELIEYKCWYYENALATGSEKASLEPIPNPLAANATFPKKPWENPHIEESSQ